MVINVSEGFANYSQRNNVVIPNSSCGPTNMIQALEYSGWQWDNDIYPELKQPEDKLTKFTRTNPDVLEYFEKNYPVYYKNWKAEANRLAIKQGKEYWQVECIDAYSPNELHDVMSYAANLFVGFKPEECKKASTRPVTRFYCSFTESNVVLSLLGKRPVVTSVDPFKRGGGHYITIVGFVTNDNFIVPKNEEEAKAQLKNIKEYIIDNTYGKFDFVNKKYVAVSGNDEHIERSKLLDIVKSVSHYFSLGPATCC